MAALPPQTGPRAPPLGPGASRRGERTDEPGRGLRIMLHQAKDRQKFISDVQYLRDMQHKVDSEYQACLRRQEYRRDPNEKKRDQFGGQETNFERSQFSSGSSFKQSSGEEDPLTKTRLSAENPAVKCDSRLPAIDQSSVKQKHKSTITPQKPEKAGPSNPSPEAQAPQILSRKRRPNLGRLTVSPEIQRPQASGDRSRQQKLRLLAKAPALRGADPAAPREGPIWAGDAKLKRPSRERGNVVRSSQLMPMPGSPPERARKGEPAALSQNEARQALSRACQGASGPQGVRESLGPLLTTSTMGGPRRVPFRFRDEDFHSVLPLNSGEENDDTEEEIQVEEELLLAGMRPPRSPASYKRNTFPGTSATQAKNKNFEGNPENCRVTSAGRSESNHGSLRRSGAVGPVTDQPSVGQRVFQDPGLPDGGPPKENDSENEKKTFNSWDAKFEPGLDGDLTAENVFSDCVSREDRPSTRSYERDWQTYLNSPRSSPDYFVSGRPTAPRSPMNSSYNTPRSSMHRVLRDDIPVRLSLSTLFHSPDAEGNSMYNVCQPLSPIGHRNPFASTGNHSYFPVNSGHEFDVRGAENITLTSPSLGAPLHTEDLLLNPQSSLPLVEPSSSSPSRRNLQGHLQVPGSLQESTPFTFFAVSDFQNDNATRMAVSDFTDEKEDMKIKADPEKLKKLQESLLEEDSEEEGDSCRICLTAGGFPANPLLEPCSCVGSLRFVHRECLRKWLEVKITSGADLGTVKTCEMCKRDLLVDLDDFNVIEFYQRHQHSRTQNELMNSGLYLVLLLHLYEQRFAELLRLNYNWAARERRSDSVFTRNDVWLHFLEEDQVPSKGLCGVEGEAQTYDSLEPHVDLAKSTKMWEVNRPASEASKSTWSSLSQSEPCTPTDFSLG